MGLILTEEYKDNIKNKDWKNKVDKGIRENIDKMFFTKEGDRGSGKTTALVFASLKYNIPIVTTCHNGGKHIEKIVDKSIMQSEAPKTTKIKYSIGDKSRVPEVILANEVINKVNKNREYENGVLVDEMSIIVLSKVLEQLFYQGVRIRSGFFPNN